MEQRYQAVLAVIGEGETVKAVAARFVSRPGFDAVLVPWLSGPEKETVDHGSSPEVLR